MELPSITAASFFQSDADFSLLIEIASFLSPRDAMRLSQCSRALQPLSTSEPLWCKLWPWPSQRRVRESPPDRIASTWRRASELHTLYRSKPPLSSQQAHTHFDLTGATTANNTNTGQTIHRHGLVNGLSSHGGWVDEDEAFRESSPLILDVTCSCVSDEWRVLGYSSGLVRVFGPINGGSTSGGGSSPKPQSNSPSYRDFHIPFGSIRHMQLEVMEVPDPSHPASFSSSSMFELNRGFGFVLRRKGRVDPSCPPLKRLYRCYTGSWDGAVNCIDLELGTVKCIVQNLDGPVYGIRVDLSNDKRAPEGKLFTCEGSGRIHIWDIASGNSLGTLEGHTGAVTDLCVQRFEQIAASNENEGGDGDYSYHHYGAGELVTYKRLISCSSDSTVRVWDLTTQLCVNVLLGHRGPVWTVAVIRDVIFSGSADGTIRVWQTIPKRSRRSERQPHMATVSSSITTHSPPPPLQPPQPFSTTSSLDYSRHHYSDNNLLPFHASNYPVDPSSPVYSSSYSSSSSSTLDTYTVLNVLASDGDTFIDEKSTSVNSSTSSFTSSQQHHLHSSSIEHSLPVEGDLPHDVLKTRSSSTTTATFGEGGATFLTSHHHHHHDHHQILPQSILHARAQVWCLKAIGGLIFAGMSNGLIHCFNVPPPPPPHYHHLSSSLSLFSSSPKSSKSNLLFPFSSSSSSSSPASFPSSSSSPPPGIATTSTLPKPFKPKPLHLWSFLACKPSLRNSLLLTHVHHPPRDGVRRLEIVNDKLYVVSQHGYVDLFKFFPSSSLLLLSSSSSSSSPPLLSGISISSDSYLHDSMMMSQRGGRERGSFLSHDSAMSTTTMSTTATTTTISEAGVIRKRGSSFPSSSSSPSSSSPVFSSSSPSSPSPSSILPDSSSSSYPSTSLINTLGLVLPTEGNNIKNSRSSFSMMSGSQIGGATDAEEKQGTEVHHLKEESHNDDDDDDDLTSQLSSSTLPTSSSSSSLVININTSLVSPIRTGSGPCSTLRPQHLTTESE